MLYTEINCGHFKFSYFKSNFSYFKCLNTIGVGPRIFHPLTIRHKAIQPLPNNKNFKSLLE